MKSIGLYQLVILFSRGLGFLRDLLILALLGASALSDDVFFLLGFSDLAMSIVAGGGAVLFLSLRIKENPRKAYISAMLFYGAIALLLALFEIASTASLGALLYLPLSYNLTTLFAYKITIFGMVATFPLVASYAMFLSGNRIYLQPSINIVYTAFAMLVLVYFHLSGNFSLVQFSALLLLGALLRIIVASVLVKDHFGKTKPTLKIHTELRFYTGMLSSGLAIGFLVAVPFIFRGNLPSFGEGVYSTSAFAFKINDMFFAFLIIPVTSVVLNKYDAAKKWILRLLALSAALPVTLILLLYAVLLVIPDLPALIADYGYRPEVIKLSILAFLGTSIAYTLGMIQVKIGNKALLLLLSGLLVYSVRAQLLIPGDGNLTNYFINMYVSYGVFIILSIVSLAVTYARKKDLE